jgi:hypothetical protein
VAHWARRADYVAALQNGTDLAGNDAALFFPGAGRSLYATVEWRW